MMAVKEWLKTCPLCNGDNQCAMAAGRPAQTCWCASVTISPAALAAVPEDSIGKRCICAACGRPEGDKPDAG